MCERERGGARERGRERESERERQREREIKIERERGDPSAPYFGGGSQVKGLGVQGSLVAPGSWLFCWGAPWWRVWWGSRGAGDLVVQGSPLLQ